MGFLRGYFFKNEPLISYPFLSSKLDSSEIKTLEKHFFTLSKCLSNVLTTGESNLDERKWATDRRLILKEITSYKIHTLVLTWVYYMKVKFSTKGCK